MNNCLKHNWLDKVGSCPECRKENLPEACPHSYEKCAVCRLEEAEARIETLEGELERYEDEAYDREVNSSAAMEE